MFEFSRERFQLLVYARLLHHPLCLELTCIVQGLSQLLDLSQWRRGSRGLPAESQRLCQLHLRGLPRLAEQRLVSCAELGGQLRWPTFAFFVGLWVLYIALSVMDVVDII